MQPGILAVDHGGNSLCAIRIRQWAALVLCEHFSQSCHLKGHRQASVGGLLERELVKVSVRSLPVEFVSG
jgi:HEAT repeat protein